MASIGSIFAEQLRRAKERLTGDPAASHEATIKRADAAAKNAAETIRAQAGEIERLTILLADMTRSYNDLRKSIVREVCRLEDTNGGTK